MIIILLLPTIISSHIRYTFNFNCLHYFSHIISILTLKSSPRTIELGFCWMGVTTTERGEAMYLHCLHITVLLRFNEQAPRLLYHPHTVFVQTLAHGHSPCLCRDDLTEKRVHVILRWYNTKAPFVWVRASMEVKQRRHDIHTRPEFVCLCSRCFSALSNY